MNELQYCQLFLGKYYSHTNMCKELFNYYVYNPDIQTKLTPAKWTDDILNVACDEINLERQFLKQKVLEIDERLAKLWYESNESAFHLYETDDYVLSMLHCWRYGGTSYASSNVTRLFIRWLMHRNIYPKSIIDFHGGVGLSCAQLAMAFPQSEIIFHSISEKHRNIGKRIINKLCLSNIVVSSELISSDVLLAQETMEHFSNPVDEMNKVIDVVCPKIYLDCSSFTVDACGHFKHNKKISRNFNANLRKLGYETYWNVENIRPPFNGRPAVWIKK